jgi:hypothetical protein
MQFQSNKINVEKSLFELKKKETRYQWLTPVILATQEAEIRRILARSQPWTNSSQTLSQKKKKEKKRKQACLGSMRP